MNRDEMLARLRETERWDVLVIGGGATGLGVAVDAAARGYRTLLVEQGDFAQGTSSRSTKLVHGGVRYLEQGDLSLVLEALRERGRLQRNAPHLVRRQPFVVPGYRWWEKPYYGIGLTLYDLLAAGGGRGFGGSRLLSRRATRERLPTAKPDGLRGGVLYFDGQFDDARLAVNLAQTADELGATVLNKLKITDLTKTGDAIDGVTARDTENDREHAISARVVVNATGVFADRVRRMDDPNAAPLLRPSQGAHVVLDRSFLPGDSALMVPRTDDGRVLFAIPWLDRVVVGTTDTPVDGLPAEPRPTREELCFLLDHAGRYLTRSPEPEDVLSAFAGLRPLVADESGDTSDISRDHTLRVSRAGLVTITGGKWTTYRRMAEDAVDRAATVGDLAEGASPTKALRLHGWHDHADSFGPLSRYGADAPALRRLMRERPALAEPLHPDLPARKVEVVWAARREMARTVEDVLARRTRGLFMDARAALEAAPATARLLADELGRNESWIGKQVRDFETLAQTYAPNTVTIST
jgi:glycerol-3-phosphate dehydrogenase